MGITTIASLEMPSGATVRPGTRVKHRRGATGTVERIVVDVNGPTSVRLLVNADDIDDMKRICMNWPLEDGGEYIEARDTGLSLNQWEIMPPRTCTPCKQDAGVNEKR